MNATDPEVLYVATDCDYFIVNESDGLGETITFTVNDKRRMFRKLDAPYFAWLRDKIEKARGKMDPATYYKVALRFEEITLLTRKIHGQEAPEKSKFKHGYRPFPNAGPVLVAAHAKPDPKVFDTTFTFPDEGSHRFTEVVKRSALRKVRAIESEALDRGWTLDLLYRNRNDLKFPAAYWSQPWGLVCMIGDNEQIESVFNDFIGIREMQGDEKKSLLKVSNPKGPSIQRCYVKV